MKSAINHLLATVIVATLLFGCIQPAELEACQNSLNLSQAQVSGLESALNATRAERAVAQAELASCAVALGEAQHGEDACALALSACESKPNATITVSNCTGLGGRATFTAAQMQPGTDFLTRYVCFWDTAARYGFGRYYDVASVAQNPEYSLPDVQACYWSIIEYRGVRASIGTASGNGG